MASPSSNSSTSSPPVDVHRMQKRARDRRAQQAMRDRANYTLRNLERQVTLLTSALEQETKDRIHYNGRLQALSLENENLKIQNTALHLSLLRALPNTIGSPDSPLPLPLPTIGAILPPWEQLPLNIPPTSIADQILQNFITSQRRLSVTSQIGSLDRPVTSTKKPNLCSMLKEARSDDETSNVVGDIIRSYSEIVDLPKQVAVHYAMSLLFKWMLLLNEESWNNMPEWLRPLPEQIAIPHAYWIDRIPWPNARRFLIEHVEIDFDRFVAVYSSDFDISWEYDQNYVIVSSAPDEICISPIFEEHVRKLKNWTVGEVFRRRFPELSEVLESGPD